MSFRKRNVGISSSQRPSNPTVSANNIKTLLPGTRPSTIDGRPTTSTGTSSLDQLLAGHAGLALGCSLLIEENGTTDYVGALLRFYAAEGLVQGQHVHVIGLPEQWGRELPGLTGDSRKHEDKIEASSEKMKIAWRYERLGQFDENATRERSSINTPSEMSATRQAATAVFCHTFDLTKRLVHPPSAQLDFVNLDLNPTKSPWEGVVARLSALIANSQVNTAHRIIVPSLLSPAIYPPQSCLPQYVLSFQHHLRSLLATYADRLTIIQSLPLFLHPRSSGLTRWLELLNDGVLELTPFPHSADAEVQTARNPATKEEAPQGMLKIHRLPLLHDRGSGIEPSDTDWTFTLSRRKFTIKPYNLPPIEGDTEAQEAATGSGEHKPKKADMEF